MSVIELDVTHVSSVAGTCRSTSPSNTGLQISRKYSTLFGSSEVLGGSVQELFALWERRCLDPEGIAAISRGLSGAIPPVEVEQTDLHPEGMPALEDRSQHGRRLASLQDAEPRESTPPGVSRCSTPG